MSRRRRRPIAPRRDPNMGLTVAKIIVLLLFLLALLGFRDRVGSSASALISSFGSEDLQVQPLSEPDEGLKEPAGNAEEEAE